MKNIIPYGKHFIDQDDIDSVVDILKNHNLTQGNTVNKFEEAVAEFVGAKYAVAMSSWTAGLHMAYLAAGVSRGDTVITSPLTFIASANAALYCHAKPIFTDIDPKTMNMDINSLRQTINKNLNPKVILPVHFAGLPCDMEKIKNISDETGAVVIEDAAHALGAKYEDGSMVGNCKYSHMTGFSFHPVKSIAAGEGGMITTNDVEIYNKLLRLRSHGINKLEDSFVNNDLAYTDGIQNPWYYEMQELGYNYRITDFQCALGKSQLAKLPNFLQKRLLLAKRYDQAFSSLQNAEPIHTQYREYSSHHLYILRVNLKASGITRAKLMNKLKEKRILTQVHYMPVTSHPFYMNLGYKTSEFPESQKFYDEALSIPLYYSLTEEEQDEVITAIKSLLH
jgi:perosamine synthetase